MTDYGRGPGSEPWHPEDPLYGDQGWAAQQAADGQAPYGGQPQQQYPQQPVQGQQTAGQGQYAAGQDPYQQQYPPQQYADPQYQQQYPQAQAQYQQQPQPQQPQQYGGQQQYNDPRYNNAQQQPQAQQYDAQHQYTDPQYNDPQYQGGWDTGQRAAMQYGQQPPGGYGNQGDTGQGNGYPQNPDYYAAPEGYPQQQPPGQQQPVQQQPVQAPPPGRGQAGPAAGQRRPEPENDWDGPQPEETHPFFTGADTPVPARGRRAEDDDRYDESDDAYDDHGGDGDRRGDGKKKGRSGRACLVVAVVLLGVVGGVSYVGYNFYQDRFGPPPDFSGSGTGAVQIVVPEGASGAEIAALLVKGGVVKSQGAFVEAQKDNPKGDTIQAGVYTLGTGMSGQNAVTKMLDPKSQDVLIVAPGWRNGQVYAAIDKRLGVKDGTTKAVAKSQLKTLGLPDWAQNNGKIKDPLEGFLLPGNYGVAKGTKPEAALKQMVTRADDAYTKADLVGEAEKRGLRDPWQLLTVASLVQAEGKTHDDFRKMSEVVYNRLKPTNTETNQLLQFDSTFNYLKGQSKIDLTEAEVNGNHDPYNTYTVKGLPPGPIGNPGPDALAAAVNPTSDGWMYFVATDGADKTEFAKTNAEFEKLKDKFNDNKGLGG
ncbi:endolytic transglycosylase MltG [Streptomyces sp. NBC_00370]|uniref:endolytic transglycosylase MltG n=1 Tax=Streptomyces sp. NBC_00370 TaxID=2975728 RepID=UPI002E25BBE7